MQLATSPPKWHADDWQLLLVTLSQSNSLEETGIGAVADE